MDQEHILAKMLTGEVVVKDAESDREPKKVSQKTKRVLMDPQKGVACRKKMRLSPNEFKKMVGSHFEKSLASKPTPAERVAKLIKSRKKVKNAFKAIVKELSTHYTACSTLQRQILDKFDKTKNWSSAIQPFKTQISAELAKLEGYIGTKDDPKFAWREQARGPTSMRSAIVSNTGVIWSLYTPPGYKAASDTNYEGENYDGGPYLTWGLPKFDDAFPRSALKRFNLIYIIEKDKTSSPVQHRVKGLYMCMFKARAQDTRLYLVEWKYFLEEVSQGHKISVPSWCKRK